MPKNEDGEFELILGNRQLLSVFFIVVVLLGVFFTGGYIVGRNSGPLAGNEVAAAPKESKPLVVDSPAPKPQESKPESPQETKAQEPKPAQTQPQQPEPSKSELPKYEPVKHEPAKSRPEPAAPPSSGPQSYLQLTATTQHEAEVYADVLKKKGFKAITAVVPEKPGLVRVLVGPLSDGEINKTKSELTAAGFPGDKAIKRSL